MRAPYNVTKESNCALCCCTVGARIARPLSEFVQHFGLIYLLGQKTRISAVASRFVFFDQGTALRWAQGIRGRFRFFPLKSPKNPITPVETTRVATLDPRGKGNTIQLMRAGPVEPRTINFTGRLKSFGSGCSPSIMAKIASAARRPLPMPS